MNDEELESKVRESIQELGKQWEYTVDDAVGNIMQLIKDRDQQIALAARYLSEVWKIIDDYPTYEISSAGRVRRGGKFIKGVAMNRGYMRVSLSMDGKSKGFFVHRLVAQAFLDNPENKPQVNHIDGNPSNNYVSNLEWATAQENERHSFEVLGKQSWNKGIGPVSTITCAYCGKVFSRPAFQKIKYCSWSCSSKKHWGEKRELKQTQEKSDE
jgi:hypothetical protein